MSEAKQYFVRIVGPFTAEHRVRAGIRVSVTDGYTGPLDAEQLKAIKDDPVLKVTKPGSDDGGDGADAVAQARGEAAKVLADAKTEAKKVTDKADEDAKQRVAAAEKQAEAIVEKAKKEAETIKANANK